VFIRVYRLEIANFLRKFSHVGNFNPALCPSPLLYGSTLVFLPDLPCVNKYTV
jgi:hypothetical protein